MGRKPSRGKTPPWGKLLELALDQGGYFSVDQAEGLGFSRPRLQHHVRTGALLRPLRGVYRLRTQPTSWADEYLAVWMWTRRLGVFSHETALLLHELADALPAHHHVTVPKSWADRRIKAPANVLLHYAELPKADRTWKEVIPVTTIPRTIDDSEASGVSPELVAQARRVARQRDAENAFRTENR